ncbi:MAG: RIP metalloprotease RseP [Dictyoglomus sp. NZ13-RE01]|nr:MAG: RIP metalloprotease RseP [Dictyoglomus sp. NZ13-RE01]
MSLIWFLLVFAVLTIPHEFGHFITAKLFGVRVYEFAIGFGPKIVEFSKKATKYTLRLIPIGGFVRMAGIDDLNEEVDIPEEEKFTQKSPGRKILILLSGPLMNFVLAIFVFTLVFLLGVPYPIPKVKDVISGKPAYLAGIRPGDRIVSINGIKIQDTETAVKIIREAVPSKDKINPIVLEIEREGNILYFKVTPEWDEERKGGFIGIAFDYEIKKYPLFLAIKEGFNAFVTVIALIFTVIIMLFKGAQGITVTGPIGIAKLTGEAASSGYQTLLNFIGLFSVQLGIFNLIPFPALDGGRILFVIIEKIRGRPIETKKEEIVHWIGLLILLFLMLLVTFFDIKRLGK